MQTLDLFLCHGFFVFVLFAFLFSHVVHPCFLLDSVYSMCGCFYLAPVFFISLLSGPSNNHGSVTSFRPISSSLQHSSLPSSPTSPPLYLYFPLSLGTVHKLFGIPVARRQVSIRCLVPRRRRRWPGMCYLWVENGGGWGEGVSMCERQEGEVKRREKDMQLYTRQRVNDGMIVKSERKDREHSRDKKQGWGGLEDTWMLYTLNYPVTTLM